MLHVRRLSARHNRGSESHLLGGLSRRSQQPRPEVRCGGRADAVVSGCRHGKPRRRGETFLRSFRILVQVDLLRGGANPARTLRLHVEVQGVVCPMCQLT